LLGWFPQDSFHFAPEVWQVMLDSRPHFLKVNSEIIVNQDMPHFDDLRPWDFRMDLA